MNGSSDSTEAEYMAESLERFRSAALEAVEVGGPGLDPDAVIAELLAHDRNRRDGEQRECA